MSRTQSISVDQVNVGDVSGVEQMSADEVSAQTNSM